MKLAHCKLKKSVQLKLLEFFVLEVTARSAADLLGIQANTAILFYTKIRRIVSFHLGRHACEAFDGHIELDESSFDGVRKGKREIAVFGILKRGDKVYTVVAVDMKPAAIARKIAPDSIVYTDSYRSYNALDVSTFQHHRINRSNHFAQGKNHIDCVENFWNQAKRVLRKYNGINRNSFPLFLKECEFRFNYGTPSQQHRTLRRWCGL